jgi:hypothetical protein
MFDLPYIATHPLLAQIMKHCATLSEEADGLPPGSPARKKLDRRITELEQYRLPKPDARDLKESEPILDSSRQQIGERHSLRKRFVPKRRGRPEEFRIRTRAALEEKLAHPRTTWRELAAKHRFQDRKDLERVSDASKRSLNAKESPSRPRRITRGLPPNGPNCSSPRRNSFVRIIPAYAANAGLPESDRNQRLLRSGLLNDRICKDGFRHKDVGFGTCRGDPRRRPSVQACCHV